MATLSWINPIIVVDGQKRIDSRYREYTIVGRRSRYVTHSWGVAQFVRIWLTIIA